jgi:hypothetical protein
MAEFHHDAIALLQAGVGEGQAPKAITGQPIDARLIVNNVGRKLIYAPMTVKGILESPRQVRIAIGRRQSRSLQNQFRLDQILHQVYLEFKALLYH